MGGAPGEAEIQHRLAERLTDLGLTVDLWPIDLAALRADAAVEWRRAEEAAWGGELPEGYRAYRVHFVSQEAIVDEVAALGPEAILLEPEDARLRLIERLREAAA